MNAGLQGLVQLQALGVEMSAAMSDGALCRMLEVFVNIWLLPIHRVGDEPGWMLMHQFTLELVW